MGNGPVLPSVRSAHWDSAMALIAPMVPKIANKLTLMSVLQHNSADHNYALEKAQDGVNSQDPTGLALEYNPRAKGFMKWLDKKIRRAGGVTVGITQDAQGRYNQIRDNGFPNPAVLVGGALYLGVTLVP